MRSILTSPTTLFVVVVLIVIAILLWRLVRRPTRSQVTGSPSPSTSGTGQPDSHGTVARPQDAQ